MNIMQSFKNLFGNTQVEGTPEQQGQLRETSVMPEMRMHHEVPYTAHNPSTLYKNNPDSVAMAIRSYGSKPKTSKFPKLQDMFK